jgi:hypothetical protein
MDSTGPPAAPTALYTNIASPVAKPPSSMPSRLPHGGNGGTGGNRYKYHNKNHNSGNDGGHNGKNSTCDRGRGGSSSQTTVPTSSDDRTNAPWPTYDHPWQGHMTMYPSPVPTGQQHPQAFVVTPGLYASPGPLSGPQQQPLYQQSTPSPGWNPWLDASWDQQSLANSFSSMALHLPPTSVQDWVADSGVTHHTTPSVDNISTFRPILPLSL